MKRKFSFNLAPIKTGTKHETKHTPEPTPSHQKQPSQPPSQSSQSHSRQTSKDSICDHSPFIQRRVLDPKTDHELRAACRLILQNFKPSDHGMEDTDPKLDFGGLQRGRERTKDRNAHRSEPKVRLPTGAPIDLKTALEARGLKQTELTLGKQPGDAPTRANSSRKRADFGWLDDRDEKREANLRKSSSTRRKRSIDPASDAAANATATEWMRNGESSREHPSDPQARPSTAVRPPSRSKSIRNNIKEYVFPGTNSRSLSRAPSHGSLNTMNTNLSQDSSADPPTSATSASGWRNWALPRRSSSRSNSRPGTSRGQLEEADQPKKPNPNVVNLTKELPPLPSLDSWKDNDEPPQEKVKSPTSATHIASVMRPQDAPQPERTTAQRKQHRRSGSDTLVMQYNASVAARSPTHSKHGAPTGSRSKTLTPDSLGVATTLVGSSSTSNLDYTRHRSSESTSTPKKSSEIVNFSRKMSVEVSTRSNFSHEAKLSRKEEQKSRLKKVFTGWMSKKEKKDHWMHRIEKEGVKEGVLVQDSASAPIVRY